MAGEISLADSLGMLNSAIQFAGAAVGASDDKDFIIGENQKAREFSLEMWNKQNEYNLPINVYQRQMEGLQANGLNPNLIYGEGMRSMADAVTIPGHSAPNMGSKDIAQYLDFMQGAMQRAMVESQIKTNDALQTKYLADAGEAESRINLNNSNSDFLKSLKLGQENENEWYNLTKEVKLTLLNLDTAISSGKVNLMAEQANRLIAQTANDTRLVEIRDKAVSETLAQGWKQLSLNEKELIGRLELWAKQGNAALLSAKSQWLNAITQSKAFDLAKQKFDKFSDDQIKLIKANITRLTKQNAWYDIIQENKVLLMGKDYDVKNVNEDYIQKQIDLMETKLLMDFIGDIF